MRRTIIAGNWKMNKLPNDAMNFINHLKYTAKKCKDEIILCVPYTDLYYSLLTAQDVNIHIGAQNMHWSESGAYTGEISPDMLTTLGVEYVIIGHSERRKYFNEKDEDVNKKVISAVRHELKPIICVGENLEQRKEKKTIDVIRKQTLKALDGLTTDDISRVVVAYEPIWAIGTGKTATAKDANKCIGEIRKAIKEKFDTDNVSILYGGSVNAENASELFNMPEIDGGLIGGASLNVEEFMKIINYNGGI